jgi:hypothetical protein
MPIKETYSNYFQKSKTFLLPALGLRKCEQTASIMTFISWEGRYTPADYKLVLVKLGNIDDPEYRRFEKIYLLSNTLFETIIPIDKETIAYVFNFERLKDDWNYFLRGKYSRLSITLKDRIRSYYGDIAVEWEYVKSFLYPNDYFEEYARLLNVHPDLLAQVGELCDPWNNDFETFKVVDHVMAPVV